MLQSEKEALKNSRDLLVTERDALERDLRELMSNENCQNAEQSTMDSSRLSQDDPVKRDTDPKAVLQWLKDHLEDARRRTGRLEERTQTLEKDILSRDQLIGELRTENEQLEMDMNKLRNSNNLSQLERTEIENQVQREKMLRLLDQKGIAEIRGQLQAKQTEIDSLSRLIGDQRAELAEQARALSSAKRDLVASFRDSLKGLQSQLEQRARTIVTLREEVMRLKENKVFVLNSGAEAEEQGQVYLGQLGMGVHDESRMWFGSQLLQSGRKAPKKVFLTEDLKRLSGREVHTPNSSLFGNNSRVGGAREEMSEMESILHSKLEILEDERENLLGELTMRDEAIRDLQERCMKSKQLIEENLEIIEQKKNEDQIRANLADPAACGRIRQKSRFVAKLLKIAYGACIDLFLKLDRPSLIKLEKKLNNCLQLYTELNELIFST